MNAKIILAALAVAAVAGCTGLEESRSGGDDDAAERRIQVNVPDDATHIRVDASAVGESGEADVTVLIESEDGTNLADDTFSVAEGSVRLEVDATGHDRMFVVVRVVDGEARLDVRVTAVVPGQPEVVVVREEVVVRVEHTTPPPATTTPPSPTPASPPPATTPPTQPTPPSPPTNATNETNATNTSG